MAVDYDQLIADDAKNMVAAPRSGGTGDIDYDALIAQDAQDNKQVVQEMGNMEDFWTDPADASRPGVIPQSISEPESDIDYDALIAQDAQDNAYHGSPRNTEEFLASEESRPSGDFARGLGAGIEGMKVTGHALAGQAKDIVGLDPTKQYMDALAIQQAADKKFGGGIDKVENIHGPGDFIDWAQYTTGRLAPDLALIATGAGAADVMGKMAAKKAGNLLLKKAALKGGTAGLVGSSGLIESAGNWQESMGRVAAGTQDETHPLMDLGAGMVSGATEAFSPVMRLLPGSIVKKMSGGFVNRLVKSTIGESGQEVSQSLVGNLNAALQDPTVSMTDKDAISEYLNSAAAGALMGPLGGMSRENVAGARDVMSGMPLDPNNPSNPVNPSEPPMPSGPPAYFDAMDDSGFTPTTIDTGNPGLSADPAAPADPPQTSLYHRITRPIDKVIQPISSRLDKLHEDLKPLLRRSIFDAGERTMETTEVSDALYDAIGELSDAKRARWDHAAYTRDLATMNKLAKAYGIEEEYTAYRGELDNLLNDAVDAGEDIKPARGFMPIRAKNDKALDNIRTLLQKRRIPNLDRAIQKSKEATPQQALVDYSTDEEMRSEGSDTGEVLQAAREYMTQHPDTPTTRKIKQNLMGLRAASQAHISDTVGKIHDNRLAGGISPFVKNQQERLNELADKPLLTAQELGEKRQLELDIQAYYDKTGKRAFAHYFPELKNQDQIDEVNGIFNAYLNQKGTTGAVDAVKKFELMDTLGSSFNALTQIGDLIYPMYENGAVDTIVGLTKSIGKNKKGLTKTDLGIDANQIAAEFDKGNFSSWLTEMFKWTGFTGIDNIGKSTFINSTARKLNRVAKNNPKVLRKQFRNTIPDSSMDSVIKEFKEYTPGKKLSSDAKFILFSKLLDYQPIALSEVPEVYLKSGNGRIFYMLKTFALKQLDIMRRESLHKMRTGPMRQRKEGALNMVKMGALLIASGFGVDELKDAFKGKWPARDAGDRLDSVFNSILRVFFLSKYGLEDSHNSIGTFLKQMLPPAKLPIALEKDIRTAGDGKGLRSVKSIPWGGEAYSNWFGHDRKKLADKRSFAQRQYSKLKSKYWDKEYKGTREYKALHRYQGEINKLSTKITTLKKKDPVRYENHIEKLKDKRDDLMIRIMGRLGWDPIWVPR